MPRRLPGHRILKASDPADRRGEGETAFEPAGDVPEAPGARVGRLSVGLGSGPR